MSAKTADQAVEILYEITSAIDNGTLDRNLLPKNAYSALGWGIGAIKSNQENVDLHWFLERQKDLQVALGVTPNPIDIMTEPLFKDVLIMMAGEVQETLACLLTATKPWKAGTIDNREHLEEELIDVLFFFLEACNLAGLTAEKIQEKYDAKRKRNLERLKESGKPVTALKVSSDTEHELLYLAMQKAAGMLSSKPARDFLWMTVWNAEDAMRDPSNGRPTTILMEGLRELKPKLSSDDWVTLSNCLLDELGNSMHALIVEKVDSNGLRKEEG